MAGSTPQDAVRCQDCGGETLGPFVLGAGDGTGLSPVGRRAGFFARPSPLRASVCLSCGSVKLLAADLDELREMARYHRDLFE